MLNIQGFGTESIVPGISLPCSSSLLTMPHMSSGDDIFLLKLGGIHHALQVYCIASRTVIVGDASRNIKLVVPHLERLRNITLPLPPVHLECSRHLQRWKDNLIENDMRSSDSVIPVLPLYYKYYFCHLNDGANQCRV